MGFNAFSVLFLFFGGRGTGGCRFGEDCDNCHWIFQFAEAEPRALKGLGPGA